MDKFVTDPSFEAVKTFHTASLQSSQMAIVGRTPECLLDLDLDLRGHSTVWAVARDSHSRSELLQDIDVRRDATGGTRSRTTLTLEGNRTATPVSPCEPAHFKLETCHGEYPALLWKAGDGQARLIAGHCVAEELPCDDTVVVNFIDNKVVVIIRVYNLDYRFFHSDGIGVVKTDIPVFTLTAENISDVPDKYTRGGGVTETAAVVTASRPRVRHRPSTATSPTVDLHLSLESHYFLQSYYLRHVQWASLSSTPTLLVSTGYYQQQPDTPGGEPKQTLHKLVPPSDDNDVLGWWMHGRSPSVFCAYYRVSVSVKWLFSSCKHTMSDTDRQPLIKANFHCSDHHSKRTLKPRGVS
ncbi:hypothetical protein GGX14DRAFT_391706 [Mycena pura]|uniref:Uncharacterized protein n=1 Tax=Mycena pura TaxID=153505 RepID=A0AAD6YDZ8_9AGAR|nr:hypothetical protein GGX14DRAFT_391706 [Mycena pura]